MSSPVLVLGATGYIGTATVNSLSQKGIATRIGVRDPASDKAKPLVDLKGVEAVKADMSEPQTLSTAFAGVKTALIVTPGALDRAKLVANAVAEAKKAGVEYISAITFPAVDAKDDILFKRQGAEIEETLKSSGLKYTVVRLPMFFDNQWGNIQSIKEQGKIYSPAKPDAKYAEVAVADAGEALANLLNAPAEYANKTITLSSDTVTHNVIAATFTAAIGKQVDYVQVPGEAAVEAMKGLGMPEWQGKGVVELFELGNNEDPAATFAPKDLEKLLGRSPTTFKAWVDGVANAFK
eukprot:m.161620 g.161620  ORF g.161620 m.161620 type:complete len:294 (+) comp12097_c0_seq1:273-1154(+)